MNEKEVEEITGRIRSSKIAVNRLERIGRLLGDAANDISDEVSVDPACVAAHLAMTLFGSTMTAVFMQSGDVTYDAADKFVKGNAEAVQQLLTESLKDKSHVV